MVMIKAKMKMALEAMLILLVMGLEVVSGASQCSSRSGGEELSCQLRTLQSGLQASAAWVWWIANDTYKVTQKVLDLGWVDLDLRVSM